jgi:hypothetical protein
MPRLISVDGVDISMYFRDHAPPHVHAFFGDEEALITIRDAMLYEGSLPAAKLAVAQTYVRGNTEQLLARWVEYRGG